MMRIALRRALATAATLLSLTLQAATGHCWDSRTHQLITRLAIAALPQAPLRTIYEDHSRELQEHAVEPDTVLKHRYEGEARRHYIDLEYYGADPLARLSPDYRAMQREFGAFTLDQSGTLPWAIEAEANTLATAWKTHDCSSVLSHAGYLAHYIGDASQPLHTTKYYDGPTADDRGMHARLEWAVDSRVEQLTGPVQAQTSIRKIDDVWTAVIAELRRSHSGVARVVASDRAARTDSDHNSHEFVRQLMAQEQDLIVGQLADAAGTLASIWNSEWHESNAPDVCR